MNRPVLIAITDVAERGRAETLLRMDEVCRLAQPGCVAVQLRDKGLPIRERLELGLELRRITSECGQQLWVNDRLDLALLVGAEAIHVPADGVPASSLRAHLRAAQIDLAVSEAAHGVSEQGGSDIVILSPIFESRKGVPALGVAALSAYRRRRPTLALYALGGVTPATAPLALSAGADGVAAIGAIYRRSGALLASLDLLR